MVNLILPDFWSKWFRWSEVFKTRYNYRRKKVGHLINHSAKTQSCCCCKKKKLNVLMCVVYIVSTDTTFIRIFEILTLTQASKERNSWRIAPSSRKLGWNNLITDNPSFRSPLFLHSPPHHILIQDHSPWQFSQPIQSLFYHILQLLLQLVSCKTQSLI